MYSGLSDLDTILAKAFPQCPPLASANYQAWLNQYNAIRATIDQYTGGGTRYMNTTKFKALRSALYAHMVKKPLSACEVAGQKAGRKISDAQAKQEIRKTYRTLSKNWKDLATHKERGQLIQIAAILATVVTAGAAAVAAAGAAGAAGAVGSQVIGAGVKAAAASAFGISGGANMSVRQLGLAALKKLAITKGADYALGFAADAYAKHEGKKMDAAAQKELARELEDAQAEYNSLRAQGTAPTVAENAASKSGGGSGIMPIGLTIFALKWAVS